MLTNVTSSRHRPPSLVPPRKEGWTEIWGTSNSNGGDDVSSRSPTARHVTILNDDCDIINVGHRTPSRSASGRDDDDQRTSRPPSSSSLMILAQHRVAWYEQMVLRMTYQPHSVRNSKYSVMESTGPLPYLLDMSPSMSMTTSSGGIDNDNPALMGRNQPGGMGSRFFQQMNSKSSSSSNNDKDNDNYAATTETATTFMSSGSHIVDYLQSKCHPLPPPPPGVSNGGHVMAYETLIRDRLEYILLALRYGHSPTWTSMYRNQCIRASLDHAHEMTAATDAGMNEYGNTATRRRGYFVFPLWSWYQTYVERKVAMSSILPTIYDNTTLSTRSGLSLELFRYNDHRDGAITTKNDVDDDKDEEEAIHQHHPFSSYLSNYSGSGGGDACGVNVHRAMELADSYYSSLECALIVASTPPTTNENQSEEKENYHKKEEQHQQCTYLFGAIQPTQIDALLFAHLAEAMCDVHLVLVLSKHVKLIKYFDLLYNTYFGNGYITLYKSHVPSNESIDDVDWISQNNKVNANNAFNRLPEIIDASNDNSNIYNNNNNDDVVSAIRLIQHLAIHCSSNNYDNKDVFTAALCNNSSMAGRKEAGGDEHAVLQSYRQPTCPNLYRWIMGGELRHQPALSRSKGSRANVDKNNNNDDDDDASISGDDDKEGKEGGQSSSHARKEDDDKKRKLVTKMKREQSVHDELWLSGVGSVLLLALIISTSRKSS